MSERLNVNLDRRGLAYLALAARALQVEARGLFRSALIRTVIYGAIVVALIVCEWRGVNLGALGQLVVLLCFTQMSGWWSRFAQATETAEWLDDLAGSPTITHLPEPTKESQ